MLEGLRVVEMATYVAAPAAGGILADWGADVIKVESPKGDPIRHFFAGTRAEDIGNPVFDMDNRGKRGVALDVKSDAGAKAMQALLAKADILITNLRPGALARAGLDYETMKTRNPGLIYGSVTGYGLEGAEADRPAMDMAAFWARSGMAMLTGRKGEPPLPMRIAVGDHTTGIALVAGILAALHDRAKTGQGRLVETSLLRTGIYSLGTDLSIQQRIGRVASTKSRQEAADPLTNVYPTKDGRWVMMLTRQGADDFEGYLKALGLDLSIMEDERFSSRRARMQNRAEVIDLLDQGFMAFTLKEVMPRLDEQDLIYAPVQSPADVVADPQAHAAGSFTTIPTPDGPMASIATPVRFHGEGGKTDPKAPSPSIGEHTEAVLREAGVDETLVSAIVTKA